MKLTDEELVAALEAEESNALDSNTGELAKERADALDRYRGAPLGNEVEGRSQVIDRSIMDTIEWIMPSLTRIYMGGDELGRFDPRGPEDEEPSQMETEVCNWYLENKNDSFSQYQATLRDALLLKNGYMVAFWRIRKDNMTETYIGKTEDEFLLAMQEAQSGEYKIIENTERPDPVYGKVYDYKIEMTRAEEYVQVESVPPDELLVSRRHRWTSLMDADFVEWRRPNVSIGQLRAEGFDIDDDAPGYDSPSIESNSRDRFERTALENQTHNESPDPSRRLVTFRDAYIRMDLRDEGTPQLWRIARVSGSKKIALKEEANTVPFAAFSPLVYPHSHIGTSIYDLVADIGIIKTVLQRQFLDGLYLQTSGKVGVDINRVVNLDDLLVSRPGQVVRFDGNPNECMAPLPTNDSSQSALGGLEYMEAQKEGRTGVTRYSAGLDANTLNKTATGVQAIQQAANQRIELIARTLAGGFKDLFLIVHALASKHCTKELQVKLKGKWVKADPRQWKKRTDFTISVGLGTGTPEQQLMKLMSLTPVFQQGMQMGLAGPTEAYNYGTEIWKAAGYKMADRFIKPPKMAPKTDQNGQPVMGPDGKPVMEAQSPPPQKDPIVQAQEVKTQGETQIAQMKQQGEIQKFQAEQQAKPVEMQMELQKAQADGQIKLQIAREQAQINARVEIEKAQLLANVQREIELFKAQLQAETAREIAKNRPDPRMNG